MEPALRRVLKHGGLRVADKGAQDGGRTAVHILGVEPDVAHDVGRVNDRGVIEGDLVRHPGVIGFRRGGAQQYVLDPVRGYPAGHAAVLDADAPGGHALLFHNGIAQRQHLIPGLRDLVAGCLEGRHRIPDDGLRAGPIEEAVEGVVHRAQVNPGVAVVLGDDAGIQLRAQVYQDAVAGELRHQGRLREDGDIRRIAAFNADGDQRLELGRAFVDYVNARGFLKGGQSGDEVLALAFGPLAEDGHFRAGELAGCGPSHKGIGRRFLSRRLFLSFRLFFGGRLLGRLLSRFFSFGRGLRRFRGDGSTAAGDQNQHENQGKG